MQLILCLIILYEKKTPNLGNIALLIAQFCCSDIILVKICILEIMQVHVMHFFVFLLIL